MKYPTAEHELRRLAGQKLDEAKAIQAKADEENRDVTRQEAEKIEALLAEQKTLLELADRRRQIGNADAAQDSRPFDRSAPLGAGLGRGGGAGFSFKDLRTGEEIRALRPQDRLVQGEAVDAGRVIALALSGRFDEISDVEHKAMLGGVDSHGGFLLGSSVAAQVLDLARAASVVMQAGAQTIRMDSSELNLVRLLQDPTAMWRAEAVSVAASNVLLGRITLRPKTLAAIVPVSLELLEDAANAGSVIMGALQAALAAEIDRVCLLGKGAESEPAGLQSEPDVNTETAVGTPTDYSSYSSAVSKILQDDYPGRVEDLAWILHPRDAEILDGLTSAVDAQPLMPTPWVSKLRRFHTTKLPTTLGVGGAESISIIGDFSQVLLGMRTSGVVLRVLEAGSATDSAGRTWNAASDLLKLVVAHARVDVAILRPAWFTVLSGITTT